MKHSHTTYRLYTLLLTLAFITPLAQAGDKPITERPTSRDEVLSLIDRGLPEPLRGDIPSLVSKMMNARIGTPLSKTFEPKITIQKLLGRSARLSPDCRQLFTEAGDPDTMPCTASAGSAEGTGPYRQLDFSKHMALGSLSFTNRPADRVISIADLTPVKMTDAQAYEAAQSWLASNFGLTPDEIPLPPADAKNPLPVRTIAMATQETGGKMETVEVEKLVLIQRGLFTGLGGNFDWIPAPGAAMVSMDDRGVNQAAIRQWQQLAPHPDVLPANAKSLFELSNEIADDLSGLMKGPINSIQLNLVFSASPSTDDKNLVGLLLPAVQAYVTSVPADLDEAQQEGLGDIQVSTAGVVREFSLVHFPGETRSDSE